MEPGLAYLNNSALKSQPSPQKPLIYFLKILHLNSTTGVPLSCLFKNWRAEMLCCWRSPNCIKIRVVPCSGGQWDETRCNGTVSVNG